MTQLLRVAGAYFLFLLVLFMSSPDAPPRIMAAESAAAMAPPPVSFSFDFSDNTSYRLEDLRFEGDALKPKDGVVSLSVTTVGSKGRMSYA
ncbi:hypothetical protein ABZP36_034401 [Zizania latifolia]